VFNRTPCGSPRLALHFILGQARPAARRRLTLTLGQPVTLRRAPVTEAVAAVAPRSRLAVRARDARCSCTQAPRGRRLQPRASRPRFKRTAIRGQHFSMRATASQFVVRTSCGSAAPGSQRVVYGGARGRSGRNARRGARTSEQPTRGARRYSEFMVRHGNVGTSREQRLGLTLRSTGHLAAARAWPSISFWAKHVLPQGAGYLVR
jgi:hypothetical protein